MEKELPNIFTYLDFRMYLKDYREARKQFDPGFTNTYICHSLGQSNSRGYFNNVISGRVAVGSALVDRFVNLLELKGDEKKYFRSLVSYCQTINSDEIEFYFEQLARHHKSFIREMDPSYYEYYKNWFHAVVRAALDIYDFNGDYKAFSQKFLFPVTVTQVKKSILLLTRLKLVEKDQRGFLKPVEKAITSGKELQEYLLRQYQARSFEHSSDVVMNGLVRPQKVTTMTVSVSESAGNIIKDKIDQFKEEIRNIVQSDTGGAERLYQINIHFFPQTM